MPIETFICAYCDSTLELVTDDSVDSSCPIVFIQNNPKIFECPSCGHCHYLRKEVWIKEVHYNGEKICCSYPNKRDKFYKYEFNPDLDARSIYEILKKKHIKYFHHANTVRTSISYLEKGALLSRGYIEKNSLIQTIQDSDSLDKKFGIWDYVFLDALDLGGYFGKPNVYGPVLFKFDIKMLLSDQIPTVRITKLNPHFWRDGDCLNSRYYTDINEFAMEYLSGHKLRDGRTMFIFTTLNGELRFDHWLKQISIDDPGLTFKNGYLIDIIGETINPLLVKYNLKLHRNKRFLYEYNDMYRNKSEKFKKMFKLSLEIG